MDLDVMLMEFRKLKDRVSAIEHHLGLDKAPHPEGEGHHEGEGETKAESENPGEAESEAETETEADDAGDDDDAPAHRRRGRPRR